MRVFLLLFAFVLSAGACSTPPSDTMTADSSDTRSGEQAVKRVATDEPFALQRGERARLTDDTEDVEVRFDSVTSDSRCPANATCVRAGEAYAHFTLFENGNATPFTLEIQGFVMDMEDKDRYQFERVDRFVAALLLLQPYPELAEEADMPLTATVEMRRLMR